MIDWTQAITAETRAEALAQAALDAIRDRRDVAIASGLVFAGVPVGTDDQSQARIMGAAVAAMLDPAYTVRWKAGDGAFVLLAGAEVIAVASAVRAHVQACFDREAELRQAVAAGEAHDIDAGWPGQRIIRLHSDRIEEPGQPFGVAFERTSAGIYRLTGHPDLAGAAGPIDAPRGTDGQPIADITATWSDGALIIWITINGELADIPVGRWITITL